MKMEKDCLSCSHSMSIENDELHDELYCVLKQEKVEENYVCEDYN